MHVWEVEVEDVEAYRYCGCWDEPSQKVYIWTHLG